MTTFFRKLYFFSSNHSRKTNVPAEKSAGAFLFCHPIDMDILICGVVQGEQQGRRQAESELGVLQQVDKALHLRGDPFFFVYRHSDRHRDAGDGAGNDLQKALCHLLGDGVSGQE